MHARALSRAIHPTAGVLLAALVLAGASLAATWSTPVPLTSSGEAVGGDLVALQPSTLVVVYSDATDIVIRRSTDAGAIWSSPNIIATFGAEPSISGRGTAVDVAWREDTGDGTVIRYARSTDGGANFDPSVALNSATGSAWRPSVDRGPGGVVAITWYDNSDIAEPKIRSRVSVDGGDTFAPATTPVRETNMTTAVAVGEDVVYVGYCKAGTIYVKRSTNDGLTWRPAHELGQVGPVCTPSITASGSDAYVAWSNDNSRSKYTRTTNRGVSWMSPRFLSPKNGPTSGWPVLSIHDGVVRAAFARVVDRPGPVWAVFYRKSADGINWTAAERVSSSDTPLVTPTGVDVAGKAVVIFSSRSGEEVLDLFAAVRNP